MIKTGFEPVYHTGYTSSRHCNKTHHITTPNTTLHRLNNFISQDFNHYPFLTYTCITYIIVTEIIIIFHCYGVTVTQLTTLVSLCCDNNFTLKMAGTAAITCWLFIYYGSDVVMIFNL